MTFPARSNHQHLYKRQEGGDEHTVTGRIHIRVSTHPCRVGRGSVSRRNGPEVLLRFRSRITNLGLPFAAKARDPQTNYFTVAPQRD